MCRRQLMLARHTLRQIAYTPMCRDESRQIWNNGTPTLQRRFLSQAQTSTALRPFYFVVHPDLFGPYPKARERNENSLKKLNQYIDTIQGNGNVDKLVLMFYLRKNKEPTRSASSPSKTKYAEKHSDYEPPFSMVEIKLSGTSVREVVTTILKSCNLPTDYVTSIPPKKQSFSDHVQFKKDYVYQRYSGMSDYEGTSEIPKPTVSSWLKQNIGKVHKLQKTQNACQRDSEAIIEDLKLRTGLRNIHWTSSWGLGQFLTCLRTLQILCNQNGEELDLRNFDVRFDNANGITSSGQICLACHDVPHSWYRVLNAARDYRPVLNTLSSYENKLSHLLHNVQVVRPAKPVVPADIYYGELQHIIGSLERYFVENPSSLQYSNLSDIDIILVGKNEVRAVTERGEIVLPSFCPADFLIDFLNDNVPRARALKVSFKGRQAVITKLIEQCKHNLDLASLEWDTSITHEELEHCCKRLCDVTTVGMSLEGCHLQISQYYSVMASGKICIPWNFRVAQDV